jgi:hypothetical protein
MFSIEAPSRNVEKAHPRIPLSRCRFPLKPLPERKGWGKFDSLKKKDYNTNTLKPPLLKNHKENEKTTDLSSSFGGQGAKSKHYRVNTIT